MLVYQLSNQQQGILIDLHSLADLGTRCWCSNWAPFSGGSESKIHLPSVQRQFNYSSIDTRSEKWIVRNDEGGKKEKEISQKMSTIEVTYRWFWSAAALASTKGLGKASEPYIDQVKGVETQEA